MLAYTRKLFSPLRHEHLFDNFPAFLRDAATAVEDRGAAVGPNSQQRSRCWEHNRPRTHPPRAVLPLYGTSGYPTRSTTYPNPAIERDSALSPAKCSPRLHVRHGMVAASISYTTTEVFICSKNTSWTSYDNTQLQLAAAVQSAARYNRPV